MSRTVSIQTVHASVGTHAVPLGGLPSLDLDLFSTGFTFLVHGSVMTGITLWV